MNCSALIAQMTAEKMVGFRYEQGGRRQFRDRVTLYRDGKVLFERFCYGESAGIVFTMWANSVAADGTIEWDYDACPNSHKYDAPKQLTGGTVEAIALDDKSVLWNMDARLRTDAKNGYSLLRLLFGRK